MSNRPSKSQPSKLPQATEFKAQIYKGIIPHPDIMEGYKNIDPIFPEIIMKWTDEQLSHDRAKENDIIKKAWQEVVLSNITALVAIIIICFLGYIFMINGYPTQGAGIITATVVSMAANFLFRKRNNSQEKGERK